MGAVIIKSGMKKTLQIAGVSLAILLLVVVAIYAVTLARMVTPEQAQEKSQEHFNDVKTKIAAVPGYAIVKEGKPSVNMIRDEVGSKDYDLSADFLVRKTSGSTASSTKTDVEDFAKSLAANDYGIVVENVPQTDGAPPLMCVNASRYLNDDGTYIPQGSTTNKGKYITADQFSSGYVSSCADLLQ